MFEITQWNGKPIDKPGLYAGIPLETYHSAAIAVGPSISSSGLRTIVQKSPLHFWSESYHNPKRIEKEPNDALNFGRAVHFLLSSEVGFKKHFAVRPDQWDSWRTKDSQNWKKDMQGAGKTVLTPEDIESIKGMAESLSAMPEVKAGLLAGHAECSLFWQDEKTGVWLKSRPDAIPTDGAIIGDLKTTTDASYRGAQDAIKEHGYAAQMALVGIGMKQVLGIDVSDFALIFIEKKPPYAANVLIIEDNWIGYGARQMRKGLDTFAQCWKDGTWPGFTPNLTVSMPSYLKTQFENEVKGGILPEEF